MLDRRTAAYHEAGHAVIGRLHDAPCLGVLIDHPRLERRNLAGVALVWPTGDPVVDVMVAAGGYRAQLRLDPDDENGAWHGLGIRIEGDKTFVDDQGDFALMRRAARGDDARIAALSDEVARAFTDAYVWAKVEEVAEELMVRGALDGRTIHAMLP